MIFFMMYFDVHKMYFDVHSLSHEVTFFLDFSCLCINLLPGWMGVGRGERASWCTDRNN